MPRSSLSTTLAIPFGFRITIRMSVTPPIVMSHEPRSIQSSEIVPMPPGRELPAEDRAEHPADTTGDRVADRVDRLERVDSGS